MSKRMFVVMEVMDTLTPGRWVKPIDNPAQSFDGAEGVRKSRVIYADELIEEGLATELRYTLKGVSFSPEDDEWEKWVNETPLGVSGLAVDEYRKEVLNWLRRMPRGKGGE